MMAPVLAAPLATGRAGAPVAADQRYAGIRVVDTALEEMGVGSGASSEGLRQDLASLHSFASTTSGPVRWVLGSLRPARLTHISYGDSLVANLSTTPGIPRQLAFGRIGYDAPIGTVVSASAAPRCTAKSAAGDWRRDYKATSQKSQSFEVHASMAPLQSQSQTLKLTAGFQFTTLQKATSSATLYNDHLRIASLTADYMLKDDFGGTSYLVGTVRQGLDVLGALGRATITCRDTMAPHFHDGQFVVRALPVADR